MSSYPKQKVFSALEVAKMCGVVNQTVINWIRAGHLKSSTTPGGQFRVYPDDLKAFLLSKGMRVPDDLNALCRQVLPTVVVVEDDRIFNDLLRARLQKALPGMEVYQAFDGFEAGSFLSAHKPPFVILDLNLPGVDGQELCRRIKSDPGFEKPLVIAITAGTDPELEPQILALGADAFFQKPFDIDQVIAIIRSALPK